jgi:hypothetical protein
MSSKQQQQKTSSSPGQGQGQAFSFEDFQKVSVVNLLRTCDFLFAEFTLKCSVCFLSQATALGNFIGRLLNYTIKIVFKTFSKHFFKRFIFTCFAILYFFK